MDQDLLLLIFSVEKWIHCTGHLNSFHKSMAKTGRKTSKDGKEETTGRKEFGPNLTTQFGVRILEFLITPSYSLSGKEHPFQVNHIPRSRSRKMSETFFGCSGAQRNPGKNYQSKTHNTLINEDAEAFNWEFLWSTDPQGFFCSCCISITSRPLNEYWPGIGAMSSDL